MKRTIAALTSLLVLWYYFAYVGTGIFPKIFTDGLFGVTKISQMANLWYSTLGGAIIVLPLMQFLGWPKLFRSNGSVKIGPASFPREFLYLIPSGICTAVIIPTTTMMYSFGVSVMIAMVVMRGCVVVVGRVVDEIQIRRGILTKRVVWEENVSAIFAILAVMTVLFKPPKPGEDPFSLLTSVPALVTLGMYVGSYFLRIYIMGWYKNSERQADNRAFMAAEQAFADWTLILVGIGILLVPSSDPRILEVQKAATISNIPAVFGGMAFGLAAIPSVFLLMLPGKTSTFTTLLNRLTSLVGGTTSTLLLVVLASQKMPQWYDWMSFGLVLVALAFLVKADRKRAKQKLAIVSKA